MPRRRLPARLWQRPDDGAWVILDGGVQRRTGFGRGQDREAEAALADYIAERQRQTGGPRHPSAVLIGEVIGEYLDARVEARDVPRLLYCAQALSPFWADRPASAVTAATCREYGQTRGVKPSTLRRELGMLQAALHHAYPRLITHPVAVTLPPKPATPRRALTRAEAARLLRAARSRREWHHVARLILIGLYTGTRPGAILGLRWVPSAHSGWVDLAAGVIYRRGAAEGETRKRRTSVAIPRPLAAHLRRWARTGGSYVVEWRGRGVEKLRRSMASVTEAAGLPGVTAHTLRHTAITWGIEGGMEMPDAASFFGVSVATIETVYWDRSPHYQQRAVRVVERRGR